MLALVITQTVVGKSLGNYKSHQQITDKQVLFETTEGMKVLVSAQDDYIIGVDVFEKGEVVSLISPEQIRSKQASLKGSIYVEEIYDALQVTTTMSDGLFIKVEKNPFRLSYIQKDNYATLAGELKGFNFGKSGSNISFVADAQNEAFDVISIDNNPVQFNSLQNGKVELTDTNIALISSKGYSIAFRNNFKKTVELKKNHELAIQSDSNGKKNFGYTLMFGPSHNDFVEKYAINKTDNSELSEVF